MRAFLVVTCLLTCTLQSQAQDAQRDPKAVSILSAAHAALGAPPTLDRVQSVVTRGRIEPANDSKASGTFVWKVVGSEVRRELTFGGDTRVFVTGRGNPSHTREGKSKPISPQVAQATPPLHLPGALIAKYLADKRYSVTLSEDGDSKDGTMVCVRVVLDEGPDSPVRTVTPQDWCFDRTTSLPITVKYRLPDNSELLTFLEASIEFSDYRLVSGSLYPHRMQTQEDGRPVATAIVTSVSLNEPVSPSEFDSAAGGSR